MFFSEHSVVTRIC